MTNIEKIIADGNMELFLALQQGDNVLFCQRFGIPMRADTSYDLEDWMLSEYQDKKVTEVKKFIEFFYNYGRDSEVCRLFDREGSYYFALILADRFATATEKPVILYDEQREIFFTKIDGHIYNIHGEMTKQYTEGKYHAEPWDYHMLKNDEAMEKIKQKYIDIVHIE